LESRPNHSTAAGRIGRQIQRSLILAAVIVGVVAAFWAWERVRVETFEISIQVADDPLDDLDGPLEAHECGDHISFEVWSRPGGELLILEPRDDGLWEFKVRGNARQDVKDMNLRAYMYWTDSTNEDLRLDTHLGMVMSESRDNRFELNISIAKIEAFFSQSVRTEIKVNDGASGMPLGGLRHNGFTVQALEDLGQGNYRLTMSARSLLSPGGETPDSLTFQVEQDGQPADDDQLLLTVPLAWFYYPDQVAKRVIEASRVTGPASRCPLAHGVQPSRVQRDQWPAQLAVLGENLDRADAVVLRGDTERIDGIITGRSKHRLVYRTADTPPLGSYEVVVIAEDCSEARAGVIRITPRPAEFSRLPLEADEISKGGSLSLRWRPGQRRDDLVVDVSAPDGQEPWRKVGDAMATAGRFTWENVDLEPGQYRIRVRPENNRTTLAAWDLSVSAPWELQVIINFKDGGFYWNQRRVWIDGRELGATEHTADIVQVRLTTGIHEWESVDMAMEKFTGTFEVRNVHGVQHDASEEIIEIMKADARRIP